MAHTIFAAHMFRYIIVILLLSAFAAQTFEQGFIVLSYYTNASLFARNCENKARPKMHCNGKCQMMKKLQEEEKKSQQVPERKLVNKVEVLSSKTYFAVLPAPGVHPLSSFNNAYAPFFPQDYAACIFHPPATV